MKVLFLGTRGIPAHYSGFETCVEEVTSELKNKYNIIIYCRKKISRREMELTRGLTLVYIPCIKISFLETLSHTFFSVIHALIFHWDSIFMVFNVANMPTLILPRLLGRKIALNTDGLEWKRDKWSWFGKKYFIICEWIASKCIKYLVTDSEKMNQYYQERWRKGTSIIEYGTKIFENKSYKKSILKEFSLKKYKYFLQITRFEPENNPILTIESFLKFKEEYKLPFKLVIVGDTIYPSKYSNRLKSFACADIILPGFIFEKNLLLELKKNCCAYIHGNQVGGTNPALLEAMVDAIVITRDVNFNREVLEKNGYYFERNSNSLAEKMKLVADSGTDREILIKKSREKAELRYNWKRISKLYDNLFISMYSE